MQLFDILKEDFSIIGMVVSCDTALHSPLQLFPLGKQGIDLILNLDIIFPQLFDQLAVCGRIFNLQGHSSLSAAPGSAQMIPSVPNSRAWRRG